MAKFIINLKLDGYDTEDQMIRACYEFIYKQLYTPSNYFSFRHIPTDKEEHIEQYLHAKSN